MMRGIETYFLERLGPGGLSSLRDALDKLLAGSDVLSQEPPSGDPLKIWT